MQIRTQAERFCELAQLASLSFKKQPERAISENLDASLELITSSRELITESYSRIRDLLVTQEGISHGELRIIESFLYKEHLWRPLETSHHLIIGTIFYGVNERYFQPLDNEQAWVEALSIALAMQELQESNQWIDRYLSEEVVTKAALRLKNHGYAVQLEEGKFFLDGEEAKKLTKEIDWLAEQFGGKKIIDSLLSELHKKKKFSGTRYHLGRAVRNINWGAEPLPAYPSGYLINIAAKHLNHEPATPRIKAGIKLFELARDLIALFELEDYSAYAFGHVDHQLLPEYIRRMLLGDFCLSYRQLDPAHCIFMIEELYRWVDEPKMKEELGFGMGDVLDLARAIMKNVAPDKINTVLKLEEIRNRMHISQAGFNKLIPHYMHNSNHINASYEDPADSNSVTLDSAPLIWQSGGKALVIATPLISTSFMEATLKVARKVSKEANKLVGDALEPMLEKMFLSRGIDIFACSKKYKSGEIDLVIESPNHIILFECKKKALTRPTLGGDLADALIDICLTFMQAQCQLAKHELILLQKGFIEFADGSRLYQNGRRIEKIAVTLYDFGSLQDRIVAGNLINVLISAKLSATALTEYQQTKFKECNSLLAELNNLYAEKIKITGDNQNQLFDCVFLGTPQISFLLQHSPNIEVFLSNLGSVKSLVNATLDMYATFSYFNSLKKSTPRPSATESY